MLRSAKIRCVAALALAATMGACSNSSGPAPVRHGAPDGTVTVRTGDSFYKIARRHRVGLRALIDANGARPPYTIYPGQTLRLPPKTAGAAAGRGRAAAAPAARSGSRAAPPGKPAGARTAAAPRSKPPPPAAVRSRFIWPLKGTVISRYGPIGKGLYNDGINIGAPRGTAVRAAGNGIVAYAGDEIAGFGNLLLIRHANGWVSAYAHNERVLVRQGQKVRRGQVVSRVGASGNVSRPQLHFELRQGNRPVNPERYLGDSVASQEVSGERPAG